MRNPLFRPPFKYLDSGVQNVTIASGANTTASITGGRTYMITGGITGSNDLTIHVPSTASNGVRWNGVWEQPFEFYSGTATTIKIVNNHSSSTSFSIVEIQQ